MSANLQSSVFTRGSATPCTVGVMLDSVAQRPKGQNTVSTVCIQGVCNVRSKTGETFYPGDLVCVSPQGGDNCLLAVSQDSADDVLAILGTCIEHIPGDGFVRTYVDNAFNATIACCEVP